MINFIAGMEGALTETIFAMGEMTVLMPAMKRSAVSYLYSIDSFTTYTFNVHLQII